MKFVRYEFGEVFTWRLVRYEFGEVHQPPGKYLTNLQVNTSPTSR